MSHNKTLIQLFWFKVAFWVPLIIGAVVAGFIICHDLYFAEPVCWTAECINDAILRLKVPLTIMALVFPAVALVASNHRSAQTAVQIERTDKQIAATEAKNAFENNIKHREMFFECLNKLESDLNIIFKRKDQVYSLIFSKNDYTKFTFYIDLYYFREIFLDFYKEKSPKNKIHYMRMKLKNKLAVKFAAISENNSASLMAEDVLVIDSYGKIVDGLADFCLSPDDRVEIFSNDIMNIQELALANES